MARLTYSSEIIDALLDVLVVSAIVGSTIVAPNAIQLIGKAHLRRLGRTERERQMRRIVRYMHRQEIITITEQGDGYEIKITNKGRSRNQRNKFNDLEIPKPRKWDENWRLVMFDVPTKHSVARHALTEKLQSLGFKLLQKSIWIHPYPCKEQIELIKYVYPEVARYLVFVETKSIDNHNVMVKRFRKLLSS